MELQPIDPQSDEFSHHDANILFNVHRIEEGEGNYEVGHEHGDYTKQALMPLRYFRYYLRNNQYPHPTLLRYFDVVFQRIIDGESLESAFGLKAGRGRRPDDEIYEVRTLKEKAGMAVLADTMDGTKQVRYAIKAAADHYGLGEDAVERAYHEVKRDYEQGRELARKAQEPE